AEDQAAARCPFLEDAADAAAVAAPALDEPAAAPDAAELAAAAAHAALDLQVARFEAETAMREAAARIERDGTEAAGAAIERARQARAALRDT
ncbi:hypothetical protein, partial [Citrobacter braakii]|uniref:hypothetical protein n=1 Tax=Citrobacter braakii TaxID=57706 RepID=UPI00197CFCEA